MSDTVNITKEQWDNAVAELLSKYPLAEILKKSGKTEVVEEPAERGISVDTDKKRVEFSFDIAVFAIQGTFALPARLDLRANFVGLELAHTVIDLTEEVSFNPGVGAVHLLYGFRIKNRILQFFGRLGWPFNQDWEIDIINIDTLAS